MRRIFLVNALVLLAVVAVAGIVGWVVYNNYYYYSTDDAHLTAPVVNVASTAAGTLQTFTIKIGDTVAAGQTVGTVATADNRTVNVVAPIGGTILQVPGVAGQMVSPGLPIAQMANLGSVSVTAYVDETSFKDIGLGKSVDVYIDAYSDTSFSGHITQVVNASADQFSLLPTQDFGSGNFTKVSQRIPVIIALDGNGGKTLTPGMSAEVRIHIN